MLLSMIFSIQNTPGPAKPCLLPIFDTLSLMVNNEDVLLNFTVFLLTPFGTPNVLLISPLHPCDEKEDVKDFCSVPFMTQSFSNIRRVYWHIFD